MAWHAAKRKFVPDIAGGAKSNSIKAARRTRHSRSENDENRRRVFSISDDCVTWVDPASARCELFPLRGKIWLIRPYGRLPSLRYVDAGNSVGWGSKRRLVSSPLCPAIVAQRMATRRAMRRRARPLRLYLGGADSHVHRFPDPPMAAKCSAKLTAVCCVAWTSKRPTKNHHLRGRCELLLKQGLRDGPAPPRRRRLLIDEVSCNDPAVQGNRQATQWLVVFRLAKARLKDGSIRCAKTP